MPQGRPVRREEAAVESGDTAHADGKKGAPLWLAAIVVFLALAAGVVVVLMARSSDGDSETATTAPSAAPAELVLEPAGSAGDDPFSASVAIYETPLPAEASLASTAQVEGNEPGLYGGTEDQKACDPAALVDFLGQNPDKAAAWASVLDITPGGIADYVATLTPVTLRVDTRVTNHGFRDGVATPRQSVLEAGTAVLVDNTGTPRVRCSCGNPLLEPAPLGGTLPTALASNSVTLVGQPWATWNPALVVHVRGTVVVNQFVVWNLVDGGLFPIEIGGAPVTTTTTEPPTTTTTAPPSTTTTAPASASDCRDDPPMSPEEAAEDSGDRGCDPATGLYMCYRGSEVIVCPVQRP
jgi:hypothetical protein